MSEPRVFCMDSGAGYDAQGEWSEGRVECVTEQGTRHVMPEWEAQLLARHGEPYNPYRQPRQEVQAGSTLGEPAASGGAPVAAVGIGTEGRAVERYGQFRREPVGPDRYEVGSW